VDGVAVATGLLRQRTGQPRLAHAGRPGDQQAAMLGDPAAGGQLLEQRFVEPAGRAVVDVLDPRRRGRTGSPPSGLARHGRQCGAVREHANYNIN
jgi:hypothetical protein